MTNEELADWVLEAIDKLIEAKYRTMSDDASVEDSMNLIYVKEQIKKELLEIK